MPLRKQPKSLRLLAQEALLLLGETLWHSVFSYGLDSSLLNAPALQRFLNRIQSIADETLTITLINRLEEAFILVRRHPRIRSFLEALFPALLNKRLSTLDIIFQDPWIQMCIIKCVPNLPDLQTLRIGCEQPNVLQQSADSVVNSPCFSKITDLCILGICNRNLLINVASTCRSLRSLDIRYSTSIDDEDTTCLTVCKSLRRLDFHGTSVTPNGISVLLRFLPLLNDVGFWDHLNEVIRSVKLQDPDIHHLNLATFITNEIPAPFLESLCRGIVEIRLILKGITQNCLPILRNLSKLNIDLRASGLNLFQIFQVYFTPHLIELRFSSSLVSKKDLAALSHRAPYLRTLELKHLTLESGEPESTSRTFFNFLSHLELVDVPLSLVELLLRSSFAVESCSINLCQRSYSLITDDWVMSILARNPLRQLQKLSIRGNNTLTMLTVRSLINTCSLLKSIDGLSSWGGIAALELDAFRQEIRRNNFSLIIDP